MKKLIIILSIIVIIAIAIATAFFGMKYNGISGIERVILPENCVTVHPTDFQLSDVNWLHIYGEKIVKCPMEFEQLVRFVNEHNSPGALRNIYIEKYEVGGKSDIAIYNAAFDDEFLSSPDKESYYRVVYLKKLSD